MRKKQERLLSKQYPSGIKNLQKKTRKKTKIMYARPEIPFQGYTVTAFNPPPLENTYQDWYSLNYEQLKKQYGLTQQYKEKVCRNIVLPAKRPGGPLTKQDIADLVAWRGRLDEYETKIKEDEEKLADIAAKLTQAEQQARRLKSAKSEAEDRKKDEEASKKKLETDKNFLRLARLEKQTTDEAPELAPTVLPFPRDYCYFLGKLLRAENAYLEQAKHLKKYSRQASSQPIVISPTGQQIDVPIPRIARAPHPQSNLPGIPPGIVPQRKKELLERLPGEIPGQTVVRQETKPAHEIA